MSFETEVIYLFQMCLQSVELGDMYGSNHEISVDFYFCQPWAVAVVAHPMVFVLELSICLKIF